MKIENQTSRRDFLKNSSAVVLGGALASELGFPAIVSGAANTDKLRLGLIGCGGRGSGAAADALSADSNTVLHAVADVFANKIEGGLREIRRSVKDDARIDVPADRQFVGLDAFGKVIQSGVDVVLLTTPPGFRPLHFKAAVEAGKHVFLEKPIATDAPGVRSVRASAAEAKRKGLAVQSGFCWRANVSRREFFKRIHGGDIGDIRALYHTYLTGPVKPMPAPNTRPAGMSDVEWQVRNWYNFVWLSGDGLVEQAVQHRQDCVVDERRAAAQMHGSGWPPDSQSRREHLRSHRGELRVGERRARLHGPATNSRLPLGNERLPHGQQGCRTAGRSAGSRNHGRAELAL